MAYVRKKHIHPPLILPGESWKTVTGTKGVYQVSNLGRLKTFNWKGTKEEVVMSPGKDANGYLRTMIKKEDGKFHTIKMHRIVAQHWIPNPENKPEVNHINNDRADNRVENLEWVTREENRAHMMKQGRQTFNNGSKNGMATMTEDQVRRIRREYDKEKGWSVKEWAKHFGVRYYALQDLLLGRTWKHVK